LVAVGAQLVLGCATAPSSQATTPNCAQLAEPSALTVAKDGEITPPKAIFRKEPIAPDSLRESAVADLGAVIGEDGKLRHICFMGGDEMWGQAAADALQDWRFEPATLDGRPVAVLFKVTMRFRRD
jgi:hypothetical protein